MRYRWWDLFVSFFSFFFIFFLLFSLSLSLSPYLFLPTPAPRLFRPPPRARPPTAMGLLCPKLGSEPLSASSAIELSHTAQGRIPPVRSQGWPTRWRQTSLTLPLPSPAPPDLRAPPPLPRPCGMAGAGAHPHAPPLAARARLPRRGSSQGRCLPAGVGGAARSPAPAGVRGGARGAACRGAPALRPAALFRPATPLSRGRSSPARPRAGAGGGARPPDLRHRNGNGALTRDPVCDR